MSHQARIDPIAEARREISTYGHCSGCVVSPEDRDAEEGDRRAQERMEDAP